MENIELEHIRLHENLSKSAKWAKYLAIITFIGVGIGFLQLVAGIVASKGIIAISIFFFIISTVITVILAVCLYNFSKHTNNALSKRDNIYLNQAIHNLKIYFMVIGIIIVIILSLFALGVLVAILTSIIK